MPHRIDGAEDLLICHRSRTCCDANRQPLRRGRKGDARVTFEYRHLLGQSVFVRLRQLVEPTLHTIAVTMAGGTSQLVGFGEQVREGKLFGHGGRLNTHRRARWHEHAWWVGGSRDCGSEAVKGPNRHEMDSSKLHKCCLTVGDLVTNRVSSLQKVDLRKEVRCYRRLLNSSRS